MGRVIRSTLQQDKPTNNYLLLIGIDSYKDYKNNGIDKKEKWDNLRNAVKDIKDFEELMKEHYDFKEIYTLYDNEATQEAILDMLVCFEKLNENDTLLIYFAGHGAIHGKAELVRQGYWVPHDAEKNKRGKYVINSEITSFLCNCKAKHILLIVNACFGGAIFDTINPRLPKNEMERSRYLMSAGLYHCVPDGKFEQNSPFARILLDALEKNKLAHLSVTKLWAEMEDDLDIKLRSKPSCESLRSFGHTEGKYFFHLKE